MEQEEGRGGEGRLSLERKGGIEIFIRIG